MTHSSETLKIIFDQLFCETHNTCLTGGAAEPLYLPTKNVSANHVLTNHVLTNHVLTNHVPSNHVPSKTAENLNRIIFTSDYFASALHEMAHWCIAQSDRREQVDYGYWYKQAPRTMKQQACFQLVERQPQALEWIFSNACNFPFKLSFDNLDQAGTEELKQAQSYVEFHLAVKDSVSDFLRKGLPCRASILAEALAAYYGGRHYLVPQSYSSLPDLWCKEH